MRVRWLLVLLLMGAFPAFAFDFYEPVNPPRTFEVMAHRGALHQVPENTRLALEHCAEDGIEWAEVDVQLTKDHQHVILHDSSVDGKTDGKGHVQDLTVEELKKLEAGSWFAPRFAGERLLTLKDCLTLAKDKLNLYLDCKHIDPALLVEEVLAAGMERQVVVFDDLPVLAKIQGLSGGRIATMPKWHPQYGTSEWIAKWSPDAVEINADEVTAEVCAGFHAKHVKVQAKVLGEWDVPSVWDKVIEAGVDWLQTDFAEDILAHRLWQLRADRPVQISFHRGANWYAPENTAAAFEKAVKMGADYVEIDVRTSKDGECFILHDDDLDRTTNGKGPIASVKADDVRALDAGAWFGKPYRGMKVPTLDEALVLMQGRTMFYVDAKNIAAKPLADKLKEYNLVDKAVVYQSPDYLRELRTLNPAIRGLCPLSDRGQVNRLVESVHPYGFDAAWDILSAELILQCHELGLKVFSDAMDEHERIEDYTRAIGWGIDAIQTDRPLRVIRAIELHKTQP